MSKSSNRRRSVGKAATMLGTSVAGSIGAAASSSASANWFSDWWSGSKAGDSVELPDISSGTSSGNHLDIITNNYESNAPEAGLWDTLKNGASFMGSKIKGAAGSFIAKIAKGADQLEGGLAKAAGKLGDGLSWLDGKTGNKMSSFANTTIDAVKNSGIGKKVGEKLSTVGNTITGSSIYKKVAPYTVDFIKNHRYTAALAAGLFVTYKVCKSYMSKNENIKINEGYEGEAEQNSGHKTNKKSHAGGKSGHMDNLLKKKKKRASRKNKAINNNKENESGQ